MAKPKFKPDTQGIGAFLRGPEVQRMVRESGDRIAQRAGAEFEADTWISPAQGTSAKGNSTPPRAVSGVKSTLRGSQAAERVQQSIEAGRVQ